jgi:hypothetical protein
VPNVDVKDDSEGPRMGGWDASKGAPGRGRTRSGLDMVGFGVVFVEMEDRQWGEALMVLGQWGVVSYGAFGASVSASASLTLTQQQSDYDHEDSSCELLR